MCEFHGNMIKQQQKEPSLIGFLTQHFKTFLAIQSKSHNKLVHRSNGVM